MKLFFCGEEKEEEKTCKKNLIQDTLTEEQPCFRYVSLLLLYILSIQTE